MLISIKIIPKRSTLNACSIQEEWLKIRKIPWVVLTCNGTLEFLYN